MDAGGVKKGHAVCIPFPSQGHINPLLKVAKLLHSKGFHITFVHFDFSYNQISTTGGGSSVLQGAEGFRFHAWACEGVSWEADVTSRDGPSMAVAFRHLLNTLVMNDSPSASAVPPVTCVISDCLLTFTLQVAAEFGIPNMIYSPFGACTYMAILHFKELQERGLLPLKDGYLDTPVDCIPGMIKNMRLRDLPIWVRPTYPGSPIVIDYFSKEAQAAVGANGLIIHTFDKLENQVLDAMSSLLPPIYATGPLPLLTARILDKIKPSSFWKEDASCLEWLEGRAHGSVIYVNFGSSTFMTSEQLIEMAWGLASSGYDFLWVIRPDVVRGGRGKAGLPKEFLEGTRERGLLADWCPQEEVLAHPSVGVFVMHGGWNSVMESISAGVPVACWSCHHDTPMYIPYVCTEWGIGMSIGEDIKREEIERVIKNMMGGDKGKEMKKKALEWKEAARRETKPGGKSFMNLDKLVRDLGEQNA